MLMPKSLAYLTEESEKLKILWDLKTWKEWKTLVMAIMKCIERIRYNYFQAAARIELILESMALMVLWFLCKYLGAWEY